MSTQSIKKRISDTLQKYQTLCAQEKSEAKAFRAVYEETKTLGHINAIVAEVSQRFQESAHQQIASIVTDCLQAVYGKYRFGIAFEKKRNKTEVVFSIIDEQGNELNPTNSVGGGVLEVAGFGLRIACLVLSRPVHRRILIMDEPFHFVHKDCQHNIREMLEVISRDLGIQIIMVTHDKNLVTGNVIEIT